MPPLLELPSARQPERPRPPKGFRRIFANHEFTLHVWYDRPGGEITEFHLFSGLMRATRISWTRVRGIQTGRATERGHFGFDGERLPLSFDLAAFRTALEGIDASVRSFVLARLPAS